MESKYGSVKKTLNVGGKDYTYYSLPDLNDPRVGNTCVKRVV